MSGSIAFFAEEQPGPKWQAGALAYWPRLRGWLLGGREAALPAVEEGRAALAEMMPELLPTYERLLALLPDDEAARRLLAHWCPPPIFAGCSVACLGGPAPLMLRNYDFDPAAFEGRVWLSRLRGQRVLASLEGVWGALDGVNEAGLAVALTFGGGPEAGRGFSAPLILRYLLETCTSVAEARAALERLPSALVHNLALLDRGGARLIAYLHPDRPTRFEAAESVTNHQPGAEPPPEQDPTFSCARLAALRSGQPAPARFLQPPLYAARPDHRTLYSVAYAPAEGGARFFWPEQELAQSLERFTETRVTPAALAEAPPQGSG